MQPRSDLITTSPGLATTPAGSLARPELPKSATLSADQMRTVNLEEQMDPLAVREVMVDGRQSLAESLCQLLVIGVAAAAIWWLLPRGVTARPPLELPAALQAEVGSASPSQREHEAEAIAALKKAAPTQALAEFRRCIESSDQASVGLWRYYLQTLVDLDERSELRQRAGQFLRLHPDRLEAAHFQIEAIRRDDIEGQRDRNGGWETVLGAVGGPRIAPVYFTEIDHCQNTISDALNLLQQHDADWSLASRTAWTDLLHLDRSHLHHHAWKCGGFAFADPHREQALEAIRQMSSATTADALSLRLDIYRTCRNRWPKTLGFAAKKQVVNGRDWSRDDLQRAIDADRAALDRLPPTGRR